MPGHNTRHLISVLLCLGLSTGQAIATDRLEHGETDITRLSNEEISKRLENPLTNLWSITFQENYASFEGDAVNGDRKVNTAFFQPALPVPVGEDFDKICGTPFLRSAPTRACSATLFPSYPTCGAR